MNLKNETVIITEFDLFIQREQIGKGYTIQRADGRLIPVIGDNYGNEIDPLNYPNFIFEVRHTDKQYLAIACWVKQ